MVEDDDCKDTKKQNRLNEMLILFCLCPEPRPIYEVLSSHSARKAFAGNMYKNVKDPNLVCALTGHKEGSKAFNRYRMIDEETNRKTISLLE